MNKFINIVLGAILLAAASLANTGYYICHSQDTVHLYGSCCVEKTVEKDCCSDTENKAETELKSICCDRVDLQTLAEEKLYSGDSLLKSKEIKSLYFYEQLSDVSPVILKTLPQSAIHKADTTRTVEHLYKVNCTYLC